MNDGDERIVHDPRTGQQQGDPSGAQGIDEKISGQPRKDTEGKDGRKESHPDDCHSEELIAAANLIEKASEDELVEAGIISKSETELMSVAFSGMLPHPSIYKMYDEETRERMCRWNDAYTIDESARQDKLTDLEIKSRTRAQLMSAALMAFAFACAIVAYILSHDSLFSGAFIAVPFITVLANGVRAIVPKKADPGSSGKK